MEKARDDEMNAQVRATDDRQEVKPTRVVTAWGVFSLVFPVICLLSGVGLLMWKQQGEDQKSTALQLQFMNQTTSKMEAKIDVLVDQIQAKAERDAKQDQQILDLDRRMNRQEAR
jgi:hypothetical protein